MEEERQMEQAAASAADAGMQAQTELKDETGMPSLTLDPFGAAPAPKAELVAEGGQDIVPKQAAAEDIEQQKLTPEEQKMVDDFASKIDIRNSNMIMTYGAATQQKMADFSGKALENVRTKDMGQVGDLLSGVVTELKSFDTTDDKGILGFFKKQANSVASLKNKYDKAEDNINKIVNTLEQHEVTLMKDSATLDKMYDMNLAYFKELSMYIIAGKKKLEEAENTVLPQMQQKAQTSGLPEDAQAARDYQSMCERFEKKIHDLELTRMISIQTAPQIRMIQANDVQMVDKIRSTVVNTIPLWKSQMVIALGIQNATEAAKAEREVNDMTNKMLTANAQALKTASIETAKESQRGIVDMETLTQTNAALISTFDEVMKIQAEGHQKRQQAEAEMNRMENELKAKLLEVRAAG